MKWSPGDRVHVANFGKGIVREVRKGDRYLVELKGRSMLVARSQLTALPERKPHSRNTPSTVPDILTNFARTQAATTVDLHGMTVDEAVAALDSFLDDAIRASHAELRIIHGRSGGRLKSGGPRAVAHDFLRAQLPSGRHGPWCDGRPSLADTSTGGDECPPRWIQRSGRPHEFHGIAAYGGWHRMCSERD